MTYLAPALYFEFSQTHFIEGARYDIFVFFRNFLFNIFQNHLCGEMKMLPISKIPPLVYFVWPHLSYFSDSHKMAIFDQKRP